MAKSKTEIHVTTVFDGELDATDVFVSLIAQKYSQRNNKEYLAKKPVSYTHLGKQDVGVGISVPLVMDGKVGNHALGNKKLPAVVPDKVGLLLWGDVYKRQEMCLVLSLSMLSWTTISLIRRLRVAASSSVMSAYS